MSSSQPTRSATHRAAPTLSLGDSHPFAGRQYIALGISTQEYSESITLAGEFVEGELTRDSFVSPWAVVSLRTTHIDRAVAQVSTEFADEATKQMAAYAGYRPD